MKFDLLMQQVYIVALNEARIQNHEFLTPEHFLYSALKFEVGKAIVKQSGGKIPSLIVDLEEYLNNEVTIAKKDEPKESYSFSRLFEIVYKQKINKYKNENANIHLGEVIASIFELEECYSAYFMKKNGVIVEEMLKIISYEEANSELFDGEIEPELGETTLKNDENNIDDDLENKKFLENYVVNLNEKIKEGNYDPLIGREDVIKRTIQILSRRFKNNPIFVGEPGVGKTAIVEGIAQKIVNGDIPIGLKDCEIFFLDLGIVVAGTKYRGDFEMRMIKILKLLEKRKNVIVYIDEIHTAVGAGGSNNGSLDATGILKPYMTNGKIKFIGTTTYEEYKKYIQKDKALSRRFQKVDISETSIEDTIKILKGIKVKYEEYHNVIFTDKVIEHLCTHTNNVMHDRYFPDKAIDALDEIGAKVKILYNNGKKDDTSNTVTISQVNQVIAEMANIPVVELNTTEIDLLKNINENLSNAIFGQDLAVETVVNAIKTSKAGLNDENKPISSLLFVGPTGVGKTELAKELAKNLNIAFIRYDMSEYQEKHSIARLIGSPPGYVGYDSGGLLTESIRKTPHCVLLLDEIEKAHEDIYNLLLQVMDYGSLTDTTGFKSDFTNCILIMTSNAGAKGMGKMAIGFEEKIISYEAIEKEVEKVFSPEFRNRLDSIVTFKHLDIESSKLIGIKAINALGENLKTKKIKINITDEASLIIAKSGLNNVYGAREIHRIINEHIKKYLVDEILFGKLTNGGSVNISAKNGNIVINCRQKKVKT